MKTINDLAREDVLVATFDDEISIIDYIRMHENYELYVQILSLEYYRELLLRKKLTEVEKQYLQIFSNSYLEDIPFLVENDESLLFKMINTNYHYSKLSILDIQQQFLKINKKDLNKRLFSLSSLHVLDMIKYNPLFDKISLLKYFKDYVNYNGIEIESQDKALKIILKYLNMSNKDDYNDNVLEAIKIYYKYKKVLSTYNNGKLLCVLDKKYLKIIEDYSLNELINYSKKDKMFLVTILGEYFYYSVKSVEIEEEIPHLLEQASSEKVRQKIKIDTKKD